MVSAGAWGFIDSMCGGVMAWLGSIDSAASVPFSARCSLICCNGRVVKKSVEWHLVHITTQQFVHSAGTPVSNIIPIIIYLIFHTRIFRNMLATGFPDDSLINIAECNVMWQNDQSQWSTIIECPISIDLTVDGRNKALKDLQLRKAANPMYSSVLESRMNRRA